MAPSDSTAYIYVLLLYKAMLATVICIATEIQTAELVMADSSKGL